MLAKWFEIRDNGRMKPTLFSLLSVGIFFGMAEVRAEYKPNVNVDDYPREEVRKAVSALKAMPKPAREALLAEKMALLFMLSGESAYGGEKTSTEEGGAKYFDVKRGSKYMGSNGKMYDFFNEHDALFKKKTTGIKGSELWIRAKTSIGAVGEDAVFISFAKDVTRIAQQTAKRHLNAVPQQLREAWLAKWGGLLFMPDGSDAYDQPTISKKHATLSSVGEFAMVEHKPGALYVDPRGKTCNFDEVWAIHTKQDRNTKILFSASWCAGIVGAKDITSLFPAEMKAMRAGRDKAVEELGGAAAASDEPQGADSSAEKASSASQVESSSSVDTPMGSSVAP